MKECWRACAFGGADFEGRLPPIFALAAEPLRSWLRLLRCLGLLRAWPCAGPSLDLVLSRPPLRARPWAGLSAVLGPGQASLALLGLEQASLLLWVLSRPLCWFFALSRRLAIGDRALQPGLCHHLQALWVTTL